MSKSNHIFTILIAIAIAAILTACGGSSSTTAPPVVPVIHRAVTVAQYGDSFVWGQTLLNGTYVQADPTEEIASQTAINDPLITIANHGDGGSELLAWLVGDTSGDIQFPITEPWAVTMSNEPAQVIVILSGWNDDAKYHRTVDEFMATLDSLVQGIQAAGKVPVIETTSPAPRSDLVGAETDVIESYVAAEVAYGQAHHIKVVDEYDYLEATYGASWDQYISDGIHPTPAGYQIKGAYQASILKPYLECLETAVLASDCGT